MNLIRTQPTILPSVTGVGPGSTLPMRSGKKKMSLDVTLTVCLCQHCGSVSEVYSGNITHNLTEMAANAEIYKPLWRPEEINIKTARDLIEPLKNGLAKLHKTPEHFKQFNPPNGWGDYETFIRFVQEYLRACEDFPEAKVEVWR